MECDNLRSRPRKSFNSPHSTTNNRSNSSSNSSKKSGSLFKNCSKESNGAPCGARNIRFAIFCQKCGAKFETAGIQAIGNNEAYEDAVPSTSAPALANNEEFDPLPAIQNFDIPVSASVPLKTSKFFTIRIQLRVRDDVN